MTTICAKKNDDEYVVPDYIFVPSEYSFKNPINPYLMVETKKPIILKDGVHYAALENFIAANKAELSSEINAFNRGYVLFTDGITWMFLMMNDNNEIVESPEYETVCLVDKFESYYKTNKIKVKHQSKQIDLSYMGLDKFSVETDPEEWNKLKTQIRKLLEEIRSKK